MCAGGLVYSGHPCPLKSPAPGTGKCRVSGQWKIFCLPQTACPLGFGDRDTNKCSRDWRSLTFSGLLELSWPCRKDQLGPNSKFSIILRNIIFVFLSLRVRGRAQKQDLCPAPPHDLCCAVVPTQSINALPHPHRPSQGLGMEWGCLVN